MVQIASTQEEDDTQLTLYAVMVCQLGKTVHIYSCDTDVFVLVLCGVADLNPQSVIIMGTSNRRQKSFHESW